MKTRCNEQMNKPTKRLKFVSSFFVAVPRNENATKKCFSPLCCYKKAFEMTTEKNSAKLNTTRFFMT
jgi:hypothetical protein